jgi:hypothetical protein
MANWLDKYEQGGLVLKKKTKDNYGKKENANAGYSTAGPGWVGEGTTNRGFNYNGAWGGTMQNGGKLTLPEAIVYGHKDPNTKTYFNKVRGIAENYQDKNFWLTPLAGYHALEQMYSKYGAPKINTIGEDDRPHYNPFINTINIPEPTKDNGGNWSSDVFLDELAHKVQSNKKGNTGFIKDHVGKDLLNTLKNIDSSRIFTKNGWLDAYRKNYFTPGTQEYEAHSVIQPKLQTEYREIREKQFDRLYGDMAMGGTMPGATGMMYARTQDPAPSNGPYAKKTKASAQNGTEMKYYQEGLDFKPKSISQDGKTIPNEKEEIKPITTSQRNIGQAAAWKVIEAIKANTPYQLSESAVKSGIDPSLTCIGGVCNVYKDLGVDFSGVGNEKQGVRESRTKGKVVEYNPTFDKNYKAAGFEKVKGRPIEFNELTDIIQKGNLNPGDFIQYYNKKGIPDHTNIVLGSNPDGSVEVYNSYKHGQVTRGESKEPYVYTLNPEAQDYKGKKINVFRVGDQKATEIRDASANNPSGITNTWFNYNMEKAIQRRMKILEKDYQELAKQSGEPAKKLTPSQLRKAAIEEERRIYESDPMFKRNLEIINTVDFSESPQEAMYRTLNKKKNGGWLDSYSEPIRDDRGQWAYPGEVTEISSNEITMQGVDYPVLGVSDTGDTQMMYPDQDYKFDGEKVTEYPMAQDGRNLSKELQKEAEERLSRMGKPKSTISQYTPKPGEQAKFDKQKLQRIAEDNAPLNRMAASKGAENMQDAIEAAMVMEGGMFAGKLIGKGAKAAGKYLTEETALKNAYKLNPLAFKPKTDAYYRMIGEGGYADALESGVVRPPIGLGHTEAYYNKGYPLDTRFRNATGRAGYEGPYMAEVKGNSELFVNENTQGFTGPMFDDPVVYSKAPISTSNPNVKLYKENWLQGYKEVPKPTSTSRRLTNEEIRAYNQKLYLDRRKGLGNQGPTDAPPEGLMPFESPEYKQGGWLNKYK